MKNTQNKQSALEDAISHLKDILESGLTDPERGIVLRQLTLLERARSEDLVMAEKIAESFGFHGHHPEPVRAAG